MTHLRSFATPLFLDALMYAVQLHGSDFRKETSIPYVAHLLSVCALVLTDGGGENEAIAALLHDALEDHPESTSREVIGQRFGPEVLRIVSDNTDTPPDYSGGVKPLWRQRKTAYLEHLKQADSLVCRVALADKLDNLRSILADYRMIKDKLWPRFNAGKEEQLWFYRSLLKAFRKAGMKGVLIKEFAANLNELERLAEAG
ncbi:MAG: HD domain-containing protein [Deltaproteobacteria bacterium]|nr:HD domain-containing protein [Deltaproteobacteria bacterium]